MQNEIAKGKLTFYQKENVAVHIVLNNSKFHNGIVKEINSDSVVIDDEKDGITFLYFSEIYDISKRREK